MIKPLILLQLSAGLFTAPMQDAKPVVMATHKTIRDTSVITTIYDKSVLLLVFGACVEANPTYMNHRSCSARTMGPKAGVGGSVGPWVDTIRFTRLYRTTVPDYVIKPTDTVLTQSWWNDTVVLGSYYSPNVTFTVNRPDVLELVKDNHHSIFRVLRDDIQEVYIVARYNNQLDSLRIITVPNGWCTPWPDCYYKPFKVIMPEFPRVFIDGMIRDARGLEPSPYKKPPDD